MTTPAACPGGANGNLRDYSIVTYSNLRGLGSKRSLAGSL